MYNKKRFPGKDSDFLMAVTFIISYLNVTGNKSRLVTTPAAIAALAQATTLVATLTTLIQQCQNPMSSTSTLVTTKNSVRDQLENCLRIIYDDIPKSILTLSDRDMLNIPVPSTTRSKTPVPQLVPTIEIVEQVHLMLSLRFNDATSQNTVALPEGVENVEIQYALETRDANGAVIVPSDINYTSMSIAVNLSHVNADIIEY